MTATPVSYPTGILNRGFLVREASGLRSRDEVWVNVGAADLPSGSVLAGPLTLKAATDVAANVYGQYNPSGVAGLSTIVGVLLENTLCDPDTGTGRLQKASGRITFSNQPAADSTITLGGEVMTFKSSGASGEAQVNIGANLAATLTALAAKLNAATTTTAWTGATYSSTATTLEIVHDTPGVAGNAYTVVAAAGSNGTALAATLLGGGYLVKAVLIARDAEVKELELKWFSGANASQKATGIAALRALGIIPRPYSTTVVSSA